MSAIRPRIVVVGAGFGGMEAIKGLRHVAADVFVIDRHNHHCFQPLLYQVATAALSPSDIAWPIRHMLRSQGNVTVLMGEVTGVDTQRKIVRCHPRDVAYDYLVLATGTTHAYFGHDEWAPVAPGLKRVDDATNIRRRILLAFERAEITDDAAARRRLLTFVIVGGGATGVEMAGAIAEVARQTLARDFRRIDPRSARIVLLEAGPRVLSTFPAAQSAYVKTTLESIGVEVRLGTRVTGCDADSVDTDGGRVEAATTIWAAGVAASPAAQWLGAGSDRAGRVMVAPDLSVPGQADIYVIGDTAAVFDAAGKPLPNMAPAAKQMGQYVAAALAARVSGRPSPKPFRYRDMGEIATIGRSAAVFSYGRLRLHGLIGWMFWGMIHIYFLVGLRNRFVVAVTWLWSYLTFDRSALLITDPDQVDGLAAAHSPENQL